MGKLTEQRDIHYQGITNKDVDLAASIIADDVVTISPMGETKGIEAFREFGRTFFSAAPNAKIVADRTFEVGNVVVTEGHYTGTQTGDLVGEQTIPATGRSFSFPFVDIMTFAGDKVVDHRIYWDNLGFMAQLGVLG